MRPCTSLVLLAERVSRLALPQWFSTKRRHFRALCYGPCTGGAGSIRTLYKREARLAINPTACGRPYNPFRCNRLL